MKPALIANKPKYPRYWHHLPIGEEIKRLTEQNLAQFGRQFFGYHMVRLGDLSCQLTLSDCPIKNQIHQTSKAAGCATLVSKADSLPYQENSIDAFILAHELDYARDPHQILREVDRCIIPNGYVVIVGFNPYSLAGLAKYLPIKKQNLLHEARFFSVTRIKDWLHLLGFEIIEEQKQLVSEMLFERPVSRQYRVQRWAEQYLSAFGSVYTLVAQKRELPLSLIKAKWKLQPKFTVVGANLKVTYCSNDKKVC